MKAARAVLADYGGEVVALKVAKSWQFVDVLVSRLWGSAIGLSNVGTSSGESKTMRRWHKLVGLDDSNGKA